MAERRVVDQRMWDRAPALVENDLGIVVGLGLFPIGVRVTPDHQREHDRVKLVLHVFVVEGDQRALPVVFNEGEADRETPGPCLARRLGVWIQSRGPGRDGDVAGRHRDAVVVRTHDATDHGLCLLEIEVKPFGTSFDGTSTYLDEFTSTSDVGEIAFDHTVTGLLLSTAYHWRVRARYDVITSPYQRHGPWLHVPQAGWSGSDVRTGATLLNLPSSTSSPGMPRLAGIPNPVSGPVTVSFFLPGRGRVQIVMYDVTGRRVAIVEDEIKPAGWHEVRWDGIGAHGARVHPGVYFIRMTFGAHTVGRKAVILP